MASRIDYLLRRNLFDGHIDDFKEMFPNWLSPQEVQSAAASKIRKIGRQNGLNLQIFYSGFDERFLIFATNGRGFRTHFLTVETQGGGFRPLDSETVDKVQEIIYWSKNQTKYNKMLVEKRKEVEQTRNQEQLQELEYAAAQYRGVFKRMGRMLGIERGKTRFPYGAYSVGRF